MTKLASQTNQAFTNQKSDGVLFSSLMRETLQSRYRQAKALRQQWEPHWQECYRHALPQRLSAVANQLAVGGQRHNELFDGTAADAAEQLAASLMTELTPPFERWFELKAGPALSQAEASAIGPALAAANQAIRTQLERSNIAVEIHQCFLDLVTAGTATLLCEQSAAGEDSLLRFTAVPLGEALLEESPQGMLDGCWRLSQTNPIDLRQRFPAAKSSLEAFLAHHGHQASRDFAQAIGGKASNQALSLLEIIVPAADIAYLLPSAGDPNSALIPPMGFLYLAILTKDGDHDPLSDDALLLHHEIFSHSPYISFRWMKAPGEIYGRSPVMKALPDIKTANKVVELILKNATIAVTGIWQADDDGVLNPATIRLVPGAIIAKAQGSAGLTPLRPAGNFDISQLVLDDVRNRIRHALLVDRLGAVSSTTMTATEVMERSSEMTRVLIAVFGRLQSELLHPLGHRTVQILQKAGVIPNWPLDGHRLELSVVSPLARYRRLQEAKATQQWLDMVGRLGPSALSLVDVAATTRWLAESLNVPAGLIHSDDDMMGNLVKTIMPQNFPVSQGA